MTSKKTSEPVSKRTDRAKATSSPAARKRRQSRLDLHASDGAEVANARPTLANDGGGVMQANVRLSALDAAAQVLSSLPAADAPSGLSAADLIQRMADSSLWISPGGKTPAATLFAAMTREINAKPTTSRFQKVGRGRFASASVVAAPVTRSPRSRRTP